MTANELVTNLALNVLIIDDSEKGDYNITCVKMPPNEYKFRVFFFSKFVQFLAKFITFNSFFSKNVNGTNFA